MDGKYTGELDFYCAGEGKAEAIREAAAREGVDLERSFAYSDSVADLSMLEAVGHPVAVNPDRDLRKVAAERGWQVRDFRRPVRLRARLGTVPKPPPRITGVVLIGAAGAIVGWLLIRTRLQRLVREAAAG